MADLDTELIEALRARGQRVTLPRLLVHRHVRQGNRHLTADQVYAELSPELPSLSPATVYGTLDLLDELGLVRRVSTPRGATTYDSRVDEHHHVICRVCGRVQDLEAAVETEAAVAAAEAAGYSVSHAQLTLSGLCPDCAAAV
jgi:Fur family transcriptional regulator, stress-responsive regulator